MARKLPWASIAGSTSLWWSRPWASVRRDSLRSAVHSIGRLTRLRAQTSAASPAPRKIFAPKPPPTSGAIARTFDAGRPSTKALISGRSTCGFWLATDSV